MTWAAAKAACEGLGKTLAVPIDVIENSAVYTNWNGNNFGYWIGVTDAAVDGTWLDIGGNAISYLDTKIRFFPNDPNPKAPDVEAAHSAYITVYYGDGRTIKSILNDVIEALDPNYQIMIGKFKKF